MKIEPNHKKCDWTYGDIRFYGAFMSVVGIVLGIALSVMI